VILDDDRRQTVATLIEMFMSADPREVYDRTHKHPASPLPEVYAAQFLFLQRLAFGGKAVECRTEHGGEVWRSPGFNRTFAYGVPKQSDFGAVAPQLPSLLRSLHEAQPTRAVVTGDQRPAAYDPNPTACPLSRTVVYLDPPYVGTTPYPHGGADRASLINLARRYAIDGATVIISEIEPIAPLVAEGWVSGYVGKRDHGSPVQSTKPEYITCWGVPAADVPAAVAP
jgi:hypothetical protein